MHSALNVAVGAASDKGTGKKSFWKEPDFKMPEDIRKCQQFLSVKGLTRPPHISTQVLKFRNNSLDILNLISMFLLV